MIKTITKYSIVCEGEYCPFQGKELAPQDSAKQAEASLPDSWLRKDGKHYCNECKKQLENNP